MLKIKRSQLKELAKNKFGIDNIENQNQILIMISVSLAARTSYTVVGDEKEIDYERMIGLHDRLISQNPPHSSPMEHCARAMSDEEYFSYHNGLVEGEFDSHTEIESFFRILEEPKFMRDKRNGWCRNFKGFIQYRHLVEKDLIYKRS